VSARAEVGEYLPEWHPWEDYRQSYSAQRTLGGGAVLTFSHELDSVCWLFGAPQRVTAIAAHASSLEMDAEDVAEIVLQFPGGPIASVHVDFVRRPQSRTLEVVGEEGVLRWEPNDNRVRRFVPAAGRWVVEEGDSGFARNNMYVEELEQFIQSVRGEVERPSIDGEQGAAILALALAALSSSAEGRTVEMGTLGEPVTTWLSSLGRS
jgi:predicted dehydrogenase